MRFEYVNKTHSLLKKDGILAGTLYEKKVKGVYENACTRDEYDQLFSEKFQILKMDISEGTIDSVTGSELFFEMKKK